MARYIDADKMIDGYGTTSPYDLSLRLTKSKRNTRKENTMSKYELPIEMAEDVCTRELNESYTEILNLDKLLSEAGIPHHIRRIYEGWQVIYYTDKGIVADAVQHNGSYGARQNLLEIMGLIIPEDDTCDSVKGWLTAEEVFKRMGEHYKKYTESENNNVK